MKQIIGLSSCLILLVVYSNFSNALKIIDYKEVKSEIENLTKKLKLEKFYSAKKGVKLNIEKLVDRLDESLEKEINSFCKGDCSDNGYCSEGVCFCKPGYTGEDCSEIDYNSDNTDYSDDNYKNNNQNNNQNNVTFKGTVNNTLNNNSYKDNYNDNDNYKICLNDCNGKGVCGDDGLCNCNEGYGGLDCSIGKYIMYIMYITYIIFLFL